MFTQSAIIRNISHFLSPTVTISGRRWPAWRAAVVGGSLLGILLSASLAAASGRSPWAPATLTLLAALSALGLAMVRKVIYGYERYTFYHYQLLVLLAAAGIATLWRQPLLPALDLVALALATALAVGRVGCLMSGCCHGRPHRWGVCYGYRHVAAGFAPHLRGVRLFPVQALASLWLVVIILVGSALVLTAAPAGSALVWYVTAYGAGRFLLEFLRGDGGRPCRWTYSEAQWTSLAWLAAAAALSTAGRLPGHPWPLLAMAGVTTIMLALSLWETRRQPGRRALMQPAHVREIATLVHHLRQQTLGDNAPVVTADTALGLRLSSGVLNPAGEDVHHITFSAPHGSLSPPAAAAVAHLLLYLFHPGDDARLTAGNDHVYHLLIRPGRPPA